jgi:TonB-linked SusC/RagA family outer membrane protein
MRKLLLMLTAFLFFSGALLAQKTITGTVTDETGKPIADVSVTVRGTTTGTVTKANGTYSLNLPANAKQIVFSAVEYASQTINIGSRNVYSVTLTGVGSKDLGEVVVTGIANKKKAEYTGASSKITNRVIEDRPVGSFDQLLQGRAPGLLALTGSGQPGNNTNIIIRGTSSVTGTSSPLYIVDGIQVEAGAFQGFNPNDFSNIEVLRDAAATALYGSRGSAGVIVVTTKRGAAGKLKLSYSSQMGVKARPDFAFRPMNTNELLKAQEDYGIAVNDTIGSISATMPGWYYSPLNRRYNTLNPTQRAAEARILDSIRAINTNWKDEVFRNGPFSNHELSLSGGTGKTRFFNSIALYNETGTTLRTDMKRVSMRNNINYDDDKVSIALSTSLAYTKRNFQQSTAAANLGNPFLIINVTSPYSKVFNPDGSYVTGNTGNGFAAANTLDLTRYDQNYNNQIKAVASLIASYKITKNLSAGVTTGVDFRETQNTNYGNQLAFIRVTSTTATGRAGFVTDGLDRIFTSTVRPSLNFNKVFAEKHKLDVAVYGEYIRNFSKTFNATGFGIDPRTPATPAAITQGNGTNNLFAQITGRKSENSLLSGLTTASYTFSDKYTVSGSYRSDFSSKLPKANRQANFYSVGAVWNAHKESFLSSSRFINSLRVRASFGGSGNADNFPVDARNESDFTFLTTFSGSGNYAGLPTIAVSNYGNNDLQWERTEVLNIGTDYSIWKNRIYGSIDVYDKRTKDLFVVKQFTLPGAGGNTSNINAGVLQNKGFEWDFNIEVVKTRNLTWTLNSNGAYNRNKVLSLGGEKSFARNTSLITEGLPLFSHNEVGWAGVDAATGAPLYFDKAGNITTAYSADFATQQWGTAEAPWKGGFGTSLRYKGLDLQVLFSWQRGAAKFDNLEFFVENPVGFMFNGYNQSSTLNFWKKPGDVASVQSPLFGNTFSSKFIHDASFMRLRDITLSYTLPSNVVEKLKFISRARFFVQGTNLFIWTKWRGMDPEAGAININLSEFPNPRAITGGIDITF